MLFTSWLRNSKRSARAAPAQTIFPSPADQLPPTAGSDGRPPLLSGYQQTNLVSFQSGIGHSTDPNLNGWGMASMPNGSFVVANPFSTGLATFYDSSGHVLPQTITVPASAARAVRAGRRTHRRRLQPDEGLRDLGKRQVGPGPPDLRYADGTISGWNPSVDPTHAIVMVDNGAAGDIYTGLAIAQNSQGQNVLYATDFTQNRVEMFDGNFNAIGSFTDPTVTSVDPSLGAWSVQASTTSSTSPSPVSATLIAASWTCSIPTAAC